MRPYVIATVFLIGACGEKVILSDITADNGKLPASSNSTPANCSGLESGQTESRRMYLKDQVPFGETCLSEEQTRSCSNGVLSQWSGTFAQPECTVASRKPSDCISLGINFSGFDLTDSLEEWKGVSLENNIVHSGSTAGHWETLTIPMQLTRPLPSLPMADGISFWLHAAVDNQQEILARIISPGSNGDGDYYSKKFTVSRKGWQRFCLSFPFGRSMEPQGLENATKLEFHGSGWNIESRPDSDIVIDDLQLYTQAQSPTADTMRLVPNVDDVHPISTIPSFPEISLSRYTSGVITTQGSANSFVTAGKNQIAKETHKRMNTFLELQSSGYSIDSRVSGLLQEAERLRSLGQHEKANILKNNTEIFALAMSDNATTAVSRIRQLSLALRATTIEEEKTTFRNALIAQLSEVATWSPLQRPGWTLFSPSQRLPAGMSRDGVWLVHGSLMPELVIVLADLKSELPESLITQLKEFLEREVNQIKSDWEQRIPWYVKSNEARSNQWAMPSIGMLAGAMYLGTEYLDAYNLAVKNLVAFGRAQGESGSYSEGTAYSDMTLSRVLPVISLAVQGGDDRLARLSEFYKNHAAWRLRNLFPKGRNVEAFDNRSVFWNSTAFEISRLGKSLQPGFDLDAILHKVNSNPSFTGTFADIVFHLFPGPTSNGNLAPFHFYGNQQLLTWQTELASNDSNAIWIRGNSLNDSHFHRDGGHVSIFKSGQPLLIEAGSPDYGDPEYGIYASAAGHNVLQAGMPKGKNVRASCPIDVQTLDNNGGKISIECRDAYTGVHSWKRMVQWDDSKVTISDSAFLRTMASDTETWFLFHTAEDSPLSFARREEKEVLVTLPNSTSTIRFTSSTPFVVDDTPCKSVVMGKPTQPKTFRCIAVRPKSRTDSFKLFSSISLK